MPGLIIQDQDKVKFLPAFGACMVAVKPGKITASGKSTMKGKKICVEGDEASVEVPGCVYFKGPFTGGDGTLRIEALDGSQIAKKLFSGKKAVLMTQPGVMFKATFTVDSPGKNPANGAPDGGPGAVYKGQGMFDKLINSKVSEK